MRIQKPKRPGLVTLSERGVSYHVGEGDCRQPPMALSQHIPTDLAERIKGLVGTDGRHCKRERGVVSTSSSIAPGVFLAAHFAFAYCTIPHAVYHDDLACAKAQSARGPKWVHLVREKKKSPLLSAPMSSDIFGSNIEIALIGIAVM